MINLYVIEDVITNKIAGSGRGEGPGPRGRSIRRRNGFRWSVERSRRRLVRELAGIGDPAPDGGAVAIILGGELVCARGAFLERLVAIPLEHQVAHPLLMRWFGAPNTSVLLTLVFQMAAGDESVGSTP